MSATLLTETDAGKSETSLLEAYEGKIRTEIRVLLATKNVTQKQVARALEKAGIKESPKGLSAKIKAGTFSAAYYLALKDIINAM